LLADKQVNLGKKINVSAFDSDVIGIHSLWLIGSIGDWLTPLTWLYNTPSFPYVYICYCS
jgi:hypothetical protein